MLSVAIDIGGTFTDVIAQTATATKSVKVLTSAQNPEEAALSGVQAVLDEIGRPASDVARIVHGTTLATNALIERRGAKTAFVTTAGFRDVLAMRNEKRFDQYALDIELPEPLVPRALRFGVTERVLANGSVAATPDPEEIRRLAEKLQAADVESVAVGFLHSYRNAAHERLVADQLGAELGKGVTICQSAEVASEMREYERFSTVCANAYVRPLMSRYIGQLVDRLKEGGFDGAFLMMLSDGALTTAEYAARFPIRLVEGGPAGGVTLAAAVAREIGSNRTLSLDIGGTTAKICFISDGTPQTNRQFEIARAWRDVKGSGLPVKVPTVELVEIGAGGGSIAQVDSLSRLKMGPKSAGSDPGPAAYGLGGDHATTTDAHLTVGNISPDGFAGGKIVLDPALSLPPIVRDVQKPLGLDAVEPAAAGMIELADETMSNAARVHGVELGLDISTFDLLVSGGGGALHGPRIAEKLGIRRVVVPINAGVGSAVGFLRAPVAFEKALSVAAALDTLDQDALISRITAARNEVRSIVAEAVPDDEIGCSVEAEVRYQGQAQDIRIQLDAEAPLTDLRARFLQEYESMMGFVLPGVPVELVTVSVTARQHQRPWKVAPHIDTTPDRPDTRQVYDLSARKHVAYATYHRAMVGSDPIEGPAIIAESQTTTLVRPGWTVRRLEQGHLLLERVTA